MWHKGYMHYHTSFNYPGNKRISPEELADDLKKLGASFAFCAGDHGDPQGNNYWGLDIREFEDYRDACFSIDGKRDFILVPAPEIHLMFPPFTERHEHHCCIPVSDYIPALSVPESKVLAASYTRNTEEFIGQAHSHNVPVVFNHPRQSFASPIAGPHPLSLEVFREFDYMELLSIDWPGDFAADFEFYLKYLELNPSAPMGACAGVDNAGTPDKFLSAEKRMLPATFLYIKGPLNRESLMDAYRNRSSYAVYGNLSLKNIHPIPSLQLIDTVRKPAIELEISGVGDKTAKLEIYRNSLKIREYEINAGNCVWHWEDENPVRGENHYTVHIKAGAEHLTLSPINYLWSNA